ncbi:MAG: M28 family peptidase [Acidobacteria bacterium]|nr:M28 family peptidase [Acidobacteriota bacterium]MCB9398823.1 M28 family peptidase [Acidobacteriota bacterium]
MLVLLSFFLFQEPERLALVDIRQLGPELLQSLKAEQKINWWIECEDQLFVGLDPQMTWAGDWSVSNLPMESRIEDFFISEGSIQSGTTITRMGRMTLVYAPFPLRNEKQNKDLSCHQGDTIRPASDFRNKVVAGLGVNHYPATFRFACCSVQDMVDRVDDQRWYQDVATLAGWNRWSFHAQNLEARDWLVSQFQAMPGLAVSTPSFQIGGTTGYNVVAVLNGTIRPDDWYIVGAHYDSTSQSASTAAPGAEDNASGTAAVLEMARIFSENRPEATVIFVCYSGEEQGLYGSLAQASQIVADGNKSKVKGVMIMDMIAYTGDADLDCLLETSVSNEFMIADFTQAAQAYTSLRIVTSLNPFGSDHMPFINRSMPALLTIENDYETYPSYHRTTDTIDKISIDMGRETIKMNVATLAMWAGIPSLTLVDLVAYWGETASQQTPPDLNGNGAIDILDLLNFSCSGP